MFNWPDVNIDKDADSDEPAKNHAVQSPLRTSGLT